MKEAGGADEVLKLACTVGEGGRSDSAVRCSKRASFMNSLLAGIPGSNQPDTTGTTTEPSRSAWRPLMLILCLIGIFLQHLQHCSAGLWQAGQALQVV